MSGRKKRSKAGDVVKHVGRCIYCLKTEADGPLTDEHVMPYAFAGQYVIGKASCIKCQGIINKFETQFLRGTYGQLRTAQNFPTRTPKSTLEVFVVDANGTERVIDVPIEDAVYPVPIIEYPRCCILSLRAIDTERIQFKRRNATSEELNERLKGLRPLLRPGERVKVKAEVNHGGLMRTLAKIAHATAVWEVGLEGFAPVLAPGILEGDMGCLLANVGCAPVEQAPDRTWGDWNEDGLHHAALRALDVSVGGDSAKLAVIYLKPLSFIDPMPTYEIVVGTLLADTEGWKTRQMKSSAGD